MNISQKEVEHIADLSRLKLNEAEKEKFARELTVILAYIDKLKELKLKEIPSERSNSKDMARKDEVIDFKNPEKILKNAPKTADNFIEVKGVFK